MRTPASDLLKPMGISAAIVIVLCLATDLPYAFGAFLVFLAWPVVGLLATFDDDLPGGWSNPDGTVPPPWRLPEVWGQYLLNLGIVCFVAAVEFEPVWGVAGAITTILAFALLRAPKDSPR